MAYTKTITNAVGVAGACTLTLSDVDNLYTGDTIFVQGVGQHFNGQHTITAINTTNKTVGFTSDNVTATYSNIAGQLDVRPQWCTSADVLLWLGISPATQADTDYVDECVLASNEWCFRKRQEASYSDRAALIPNSAVREGTIHYAAILYRERGSVGDTYQSFQGFGQQSVPTTLGRVMQLLGCGRPGVG